MLDGTDAQGLARLGNANAGNSRRQLVSGLMGLSGRRAITNLSAGAVQAVRREKAPISFENLDLFDNPGEAVRVMPRPTGER